VGCYPCLRLTSPDSDCPSKSRTHPQLLDIVIASVRGRHSSRACAEKVAICRALAPQTNDVITTSERRNEGQDHVELDVMRFSGTTDPCHFPRRTSDRVSQEIGELNRKNWCHGPSRPDLILESLLTSSKCHLPVINHFKCRGDLCIRFLAETIRLNHGALLQDQSHCQNFKRILPRFGKASHFCDRSLKTMVESK
jgi:hypothetical protein